MYPCVMVLFLERMILMKTTIRTLLCLFLVGCLLLSFAACGKQDAGAEAAVNLALIHEPEFGGVYLTMTIDDFNARGFQYGDSVRVAFSNGYTLEDLPYYNGYYVDAGDPLLIAYPGYDYIKAAINNGDDLWKKAKLSEDDVASVSLVERGKYLDMQQARDIHYVDTRESFDSDEIFANFRAVNVGNLRENVLYRAASPCDNQHNRAPYVDSLMQKAGVQCVLDLADSDDKILGYIAGDTFDSPYFLELFKAGGVIPVALNMNFGSKEFKQKIVSGLTTLVQREGPYLVHCTEGKDRTGFVCALLEAFTGASYDEIVNDYMQTYDNYYGITEKSDAKKYQIIKEKSLDELLGVITGGKTDDFAAADLASFAETYLREAGMDNDTIVQLRYRLVK